MKKSTELITLYNQQYDQRTYHQEIYMVTQANSKKLNPKDP